MLNLAVHGEDTLEADTAAVREGYAGDGTSYLLFGDARTAHLHSGGVHLIADGTGTLYLGDLFRALHHTLAHHGHDECQRCLLTLFGRMDTKEVHNLNLMVVAVRRKEVDGTTSVARILHQTLQAFHRRALPHPALFGHIGHGIYGTKPNDVVQIDVVADEPFLARISIDHAHEALAVLAKEVEEGRVLTELVGVGRVVGRRVVVAEEQDESAPHVMAQRLAPSHVCFFCEQHNRYVLM